MTAPCSCQATVRRRWGSLLKHGWVAEVTAGRMGPRDPMQSLTHGTSGTKPHHDAAVRQHAADALPGTPFCIQLPLNLFQHYSCQAPERVRGSKALLASHRGGGKGSGQWLHRRREHALHPGQRTCICMPSRISKSVTGYPNRIDLPGSSKASHRQGHEGDAWGKQHGGQE
jgi:hypothetical protein